ncbi:MAG: Asp-tRNA(Asn)/Glu-tRNA(Gln) amidotransferase subunit GatB [Rhodothermales bacterium]
MLHDKYEPVIGLEVHCQLLTNTKSFSSESARFGADPNTNVDPISLGHPGTLPVLNDRVVDFTLRMGLATHCQIAARSVFARKHYFYPDLPKGYQISQYDTPICSGGYVEIVLEDEDDDDSIRRKRIGLTRIHMEEDAGKSLHDQDPYDTLLDYNRCGVPLIEIVSEPDIRSPREAYHYMQKIRQVVRYLGICDGNMEEGSLRCDANVSIRLRGQTELGTKTEVKNMNSFRNVERALEYEIARQIKHVEAGGTIVQQTLLWDADRMETRPMRSKEEAHDYRYFPDPDLVPVAVTDEVLDRVRSELPEMPEVRSNRFQEEWGLPEYDALLLTEERELADFFEETLKQLFKRTGGGNTREQAKAVSNMVMTDVLRTLNERSIAIGEMSVDPDRLAELVLLRLEETVSSSAAQEIFDAMLEVDDGPQAIAEKRNLIQVSDEGALVPVVQQVIDDHPGHVKTYLDGKQGLIGYFIGQVMQRFEGAPDPKIVRKLLSEELESRRE